MVPQFDLLLGFLTGVTAMLLAWSVLHAGGRSGVLLAVAAGLSGGLAMFLSYGAPVFLALGGLIAAAIGSRRTWTLLLIAALVAGAGNAVPILWGHEPLAALARAVELHWEPVTARRSYATWLGYNLWDFGLFLGPPIVVLAMFRLADLIAWFRRGRPGEEPPGLRVQLALLTGLLLFDLSGLVRGEVGRLWIPIMHVYLVGTFAHCGRQRTSGFPPTPGSPIFLSAPQTLVLGALLLGFCVVLRLRWDV
jgi:hypothetical protein